MKVLKISLLLFLVIGISFFVYRSNFNIQIEMTTDIDSSFIKRIKKNIDSLITLPDTAFYKEYFNEINYYIVDYHQDKLLGKTVQENDQARINLSKLLYSVYVEKFINRSRSIFNDSIWGVADIGFIRQENRLLKNSEYLEIPSPVHGDLSEIEIIINKYYEISNFLTLCRNFSYTHYTLSDSFPINTVQTYLLRARVYRNSNIHCRNIHQGLREVPKILFNAHVSYLDNKISEWINNYSYFSSHMDYVNNLYNPIREEIEALDINIYNVTGGQFFYDRLINRWSSDNANAYRYDYSSSN